MTNRYHVHIGVHKTATTHLQRILRNNRNGALKDRFSVHLPEDLRPKLLALFESISSAQNDDARRGYELDLKNMFATRVHAGQQKQMDSSSITIIFDENICGTVSILQEHLYPRLERNLALLSKALSTEPSTYFLGIREYSSFFTSMYHEYIRSKRHVSFDDYIGAFNYADFSWTAFVKRMLDSLDSSVEKVVVYGHEHYADLLPEILRELTQLDIGELSYDPTEQIYRSPSNVVKAIVESSAHFLSREDRVKVIQALTPVFPIDQTQKSESEFPERTRVLLNKRYEEDVLGLANLDPRIRFLTPPPSNNATKAL